jgi:predicted nuclease of predicted toxin-antitoxin system
VANLKLLLDEMYTGLKPILSALGWDVLTVQECGLQSKPDEIVAKYAFENELLLVTEDDLPAEIADSLGGKNVLVRKKDLAAVIVKLIEEKYPQKN